MNITQAAQAAGVSRGTVYNRIKKGTLSTHRGEDGVTYVDVAELQRVFDTVNVKRVNEALEGVQVERQGVNAEVEILRRENEILRERIEDLQRELRDARQRATDERDEKNQLLQEVFRRWEQEQRLLAAGNQTQPKKRKRWFR